MKTFLRIVGLLLVAITISATILIVLPLLLLYVGIRLIGGIASKIN